MEREQRKLEVMRQIDLLCKEELALTWDHPRLPSLDREMARLGEELASLMGPWVITPRTLPESVLRRLHPERGP